ncbi:hypothetical protein NDU88_009418 [Pleurodeles waltl]|uniref:Uncharacterized protein n=1 Tax=Pleurodeles waltl TaxID=8319 RepID=A0AAV7RYZ0_PLEWA|nr:hypothetical protein NDU88_009418 [Pleurodeles waltl]
MLEADLRPSNPLPATLAPRCTTYDSKTWHWCPLSAHIASPGPHPVLVMGRSDPKERKLTFEQSKTPSCWQSLSDTEEAPRGDRAMAPLDGTADISELRAGFKSINARFDTFTSLLNCMGEHLDCHAFQLDGAEWQITEAEDNTTMTNRLEKVEKLLKLRVAKNEDLKGALS